MYGSSLCIGAEYRDISLPEDLLKFVSDAK
jgi:hypothetical protein